MKKIFFSAMIMACPCLLFAQAVHKVVDATNNVVLTNAEVRDSLTGDLMARTGLNGEFILKPKPGVTVVGISHPDFQTFFLHLSEESIHPVIYLWPSSMRLEEVVISAGKFEEKRRETPNMVTLIPAGDLAFRNQTSMAEVIQNTGEVTVQKSQQGGGSPILRGFETNKLLLVVDGIRMNNAIYRAGHLQNIITVDNAMLEKAEIVYGPGSVIYGSDALGGVIHMHSRNPLLSDTSGIFWAGNAYVRYASANQENTLHFHVNAGGKKLASLTSFTYSRFGDLRQGNVRNPFYGNWGMREWYVDRINNTDSLISNADPNHEADVDVNIQKYSGYNQYDLLQKILFKQNASVSHLLNFQYSTSSDIPRYDRLTQTQGGNPRYAQWYYGPQERLLAAYHLLLSNGKKGYDNGRIILSWQSVEESRNDRKYKNNWLNHRTEGVNVLALNADFEKRAGAWEIRYGAEITRNDVTSVGERENIETQETEKIDSRYPDGGSFMQWGSLYTTAQYELGKKAVLSGGVRINSVALHAEFTDTTFFRFPFNEVTQKNNSLSGSLGLVIMPANGWRIAVSGASGYRVPNVDDIGKVFESVPGALIIPNANLKPEYSYTGDFTIGKTFHRRCEVSVNAYYTLLKNAITTGPGTYNGSDSVLYAGVLSAVTMQVNAAQAYIYGGTARVSADITDHVTLYSTVTYTYGRIETDTTDYPLDHIPPVFGKTSLLLNLKKCKAEVYAMYAGWKRIEDYNFFGEDNISNATPLGMPAWCTLNARLGYQVMKNASVQVSLENILDQNYRVFASNISAPGRNLVVTLRANW